ncbi:MAG: bacteriorhodopsin [Patescibacteria group bacterium]
MTFTIETVFLAGIALFAVAATYFLFAYKKEFNSAFLVSFITIISYTLMLEGSLVSLGAGGGEVYATRWLFYGVSCSLLMYEIARLLQKSLSETIFLLYLTVIVMTTGAAAAYFTGWYMIGFFAISTIAYVLLLAPLLTSASPHRAAVGKYIVLGWTGFPVVFLLAPDGYGLISAAAAAALFLLLDLFTKVLFYLDLHPRMQAERSAAQR